MRRLVVALVFALAFVPVTAAAPLAVHDLDGRSQTPLSPAAGTTSLVIFLSADCPISRRYAPELDRIIADYGARGVHPFFVYTDPGISADRVRENLRAYHPHLSVPVVIDDGFRLTDAVGVTVTPEVAVYTPAWRVYRGRIDNLYASIGQNRPEATTHDLRTALDAVVAHKAVATPDTTAIGCFIERTVK